MTTLSSLSTRKVTIDWDTLSPSIIALAQDAMGYISGFTTPPAFHPDTGSWKATGKGQKRPIALSDSAPGDTASMKVEYRKGCDPGVGKRPMPFRKLTPANDGKPPEPIVVGAAPTGAPPALFIPPPQQFPPLTPPSAPSAVDELVPSIEEISSEVKEQVLPPVVLTDVKGIPLPPQASLTVGDPLPGDSISHNQSLMPPQFNGVASGSGVFDLRRAWASETQWVTPVTHQELKVLSDKVAKLTDLVLLLVPKSKLSAEVKELVQELTPPPVLTWQEQQVEAKMAELDREAKELISNGTNPKTVDELQAAQRKFWVDVLATREAKIAKGAK